MKQIVIILALIAVTAKADIFYQTADRRYVGGTVYQTPSGAGFLKSEKGVAYYVVGGLARIALNQYGLIVAAYVGGALTDQLPLYIAANYSTVSSLSSLSGTAVNPQLGFLKLLVADKQGDAALITFTGGRVTISPMVPAFGVDFDPGRVAQFNAAADSAYASLAQYFSQGRATLAKENTRYQQISDAYWATNAKRVEWLNYSYYFHQLEQTWAYNADQIKKTIAYKQTVAKSYSDSRDANYNYARAYYGAAANIDGATAAYQLYESYFAATGNFQLYLYFVGRMQSANATAIGYRTIAGKFVSLGNIYDTAATGVYGEIQALNANYAPALSKSQQNGATAAQYDAWVVAASNQMQTFADLGIQLKAWLDKTTPYFTTQTETASYDQVNASLVQRGGHILQALNFARFNNPSIIGQAQAQLSAEPALSKSVFFAVDLQTSTMYYAHNGPKGTSQGAITPSTPCSIDLDEPSQVCPGGAARRQ